MNLEFMEPHELKDLCDHYDALKKKTPTADSIMALHEDERRMLMELSYWDAFYAPIGKLYGGLRDLLRKRTLRRVS